MISTPNTACQRREDFTHAATTSTRPRPVARHCALCSVEVLEDGVRRPITTFTVVKFSDRSNEPALGDVQTDVAFNNAPEGRLFVIALDEMVNPGSPEVHDVILRTRLILREFISNSFGPNDVAAVVLVARGSVHTGQDFTSSKRRLIESIDRYSGGFTVDRSDVDVTTDRSFDLYLEKNRLASLRDLGRRKGRGREWRNRSAPCER